MGKIVVTTNTSLDGVVQDPDGQEGFKRGGWFGQFGGKDLEGWAKVETEEALGAAAMLLGRNSDEWFASRWLDRTGEWADKLNSLPKYVVSSTLKEPKWSNATVLKGDVVAEVSKLRQEIDGEILIYASYQLVRTLIEHDLVDEFRLVIFPVVLGVGERLFGETSDKKPLRLVRAHTIGDGLAFVTYEVVRDETPNRAASLSTTRQTMPHNESHPRKTRANDPQVGWSFMERQRALSRPIPTRGTMPIDVDVAVRELTDRAAITEVLHTYARLVDERDFAAVAGVFTDDCLAEYGVRETDTLHSSAAVADWLTRQLLDGTATSHHISNVQISFPDADHAETMSYVYAWHGAPGAAVDPVVLARYVDSFERTPTGWRIAHRRMFAHGLVGFPDGILRPLSRRPGPAPEHAVTGGNGT